MTTTDDSWKGEHLIRGRKVTTGRNSIAWATKSVPSKKSQIVIKSPNDKGFYSNANRKYGSGNNRITRRFE